MALTDRLRDLDKRILPGTREQEEDSETYLRRVANSRAISPAQLGDVMTALREHFEIFPDEGSADDSKGEADSGEQEAEQKDEAAEGGSEENSEEGSEDEKKDDDGES